MKNIKIIAFSVTMLSIVLVACSFSSKPESKEKRVATVVSQEQQKINLFVTHGHCSTPFSGNVENLNLDFGTKRTDGGNPIENMKLSFDIDPNTFNVCSGSDLTEQVKTPGLFIDGKGKMMTFTSTNVYTMGLDWYQVNGDLSIKGVVKEVTFFMTGIRDPKESMAKILILEGQLNLLDWGIDYDKIVTGKSSETPTEWMHINMIINPC